MSTGKTEDMDQKELELTRETMKGDDKWAASPESKQSRLGDRGFLLGKASKQDKTPGSME